MKLDLSKPYGTMHGTGDNRRYEQNGRYFDCDFNEVAPAKDPVRERTKAEQEAYEKDVMDAAQVLAVRLAQEKK